MRAVCAACLLVAIPLGMFWLWGAGTAAGRHAFDEMAGIVPLAAGVASAFLFAVAAIICWRGRRREMPRREGV